MIVKDKAKSTTVSLFINIPLQPQEDLTIEYGGPCYWQIFGTISVWTNRGKLRSSIPTPYSHHTGPKQYPQQYPPGITPAHYYTIIMAGHVDFSIPPPPLPTNQGQPPTQTEKKTNNS
jgi:hypothetical protein